MVLWFIVVSNLLYSSQAATIGSGDIYWYCIFVIGRPQNLLQGIRGRLMVKKYVLFVTYSRYSEGIYAPCSGLCRTEYAATSTSHQESPTWILRNILYGAGDKPVSVSLVLLE